MHDTVVAGKVLDKVLDGAAIRRDAAVNTMSVGSPGTALHGGNRQCLRHVPDRMG